jgi:hypothetical protein
MGREHDREQNKFHFLFSIPLDYLSFYNEQITFVIKKKNPKLKRN